MSLDIFGVLQLNSTISGGKTWYSTSWNNGVKRKIGENEWDPYDNRFGYTNGKGMIINGDGTATIRDFHTNHRMYVDGPWLNTEQTIYVLIRGQASSIQLSSRANHHGVKHLPYGWLLTPKAVSCGFGNYSAIWRLHEQRVSVELEIIHDLYRRHLAEKASQPIRPSKWLGFKTVIKTHGGNKIKFEAYNITDGTQDWTKSTEFLFDGSNAPVLDKTIAKFQFNLDYCKDKGDKISGNLNSNQIWNKCGKWNYVRINDAEDVDLKWYSVREIAPLLSAD